MTRKWWCVLIGC